MRSGASGTPSATEPRPNECCSLVQEAADVCLAGNHDLLALGKRCSRPTSTPTRATAGTWTSDVLDEPIAQLPRRPRASGAPRARRALPRERTRSRVGVRARRRVGPGHVRADRGAARARRPQPRSVRRSHSTGDELSGAHAPAGTEIDLAPRPLALQPRLGGPAERRRLRVRPGCSSISTQRRASFRRVDYDMKATQAEIRGSRSPGVTRRAARARASRMPRRRRSSAGDARRPPAWPAAPYVMPSTCERELHLVPRLVDPPLHGGESDLERVGDLGVRQADDVAEQQRHLEVRVQLVDCAPDACRSPRAARPERRAPRAARSRRWRRDARGLPLVRAQLVEHAVLRHLEEPRRELAAQRELREALEDAEKDLLREVLGERAVVDEPQDVVVDGRLVRPDDDREGSLVTPLSLAEDRQIRLRERQDCVSIAACLLNDYGAERRNYGVLTRDLPVITEGERRPNNSRHVGARSASSPPSRSVESRSVTISGTGFEV